MSPNVGRELAPVAALFAAVYLALYLAHLHPGMGAWRDGSGLVVGRDFLNFWMAGRAAWQSDPARFYDLATYQQATAAIVGPDYPGQVWSYPPSIMLFAAPFGRLPYDVALGLFSLAGPLVLGLLLRAWQVERRTLVAALLSPAAVFALISGQFAFLAAAIILAALRLRRGRPWLSGLLLGLLTVKPQLGLLFPVLLLAERNWRAIAAAALATAALVALSSAIWGWSAWTAYVTAGLPTQSRVLSDPELLGAPFMPTTFMNLRTLGASVTAAYAVQAVVAVLMALLVGWRFARRPDPVDPAANALFLAASVATTAYLLIYDTLALAVAMLLLPIGRPSDRMLVLLAWLLPLAQLAFGTFGLPGPALIPLGIALYLAKAAASSTWVDQRNWPTGTTHASR
ncbi:glycosyltransferase family 87 protein [Sphingomonas sp. ASV193]|uniref:glycosyltransferase family 87 protein n=1 Tax=Sphingomonas sp. ASV193 TaxID=3144405 RepID=UPI0032E9377D